MAELPVCLHEERPGCGALAACSAQPCIRRVGVKPLLGRAQADDEREGEGLVGQAEGRQAG